MYKEYKKAKFKNFFFVLSFTFFYFLVLLNLVSDSISFKVFWAMSDRKAVFFGFFLYEDEAVILA